MTTGVMYNTKAKMPTNRRTLETISMCARCISTTAMISSEAFVSKIPSNIDNIFTWDRGLTDL